MHNLSQSEVCDLCSKDCGAEKGGAGRSDGGTERESGWGKLWKPERKGMGMEVRKGKGEMGRGKKKVWLKE